MTPIIFNNRDELIKVDIDKMIYAKAEDNYVYLYFRNNQSVMVSTTLQALEQLIPRVVNGVEQENFVRIGRKYVVNAAYIMQINTLKQQLVLSDLEHFNPIVLTVSKEALRVLKELMSTHGGQFTHYSP